MRLESLESIDPGTRLGGSVYAKSGRLLLRQGVALTPPYISCLREMGIPAIYIHDDDTADITVPNPVAPESRARVQATLADAFETVSRGTQSLRQDFRSLATDHIKSDRFAKAVSSVASEAGVRRL